MVTYKKLVEGTSRKGLELRSFGYHPSTGIPALLVIMIASFKIIFVVLDFAEAFIPWALGPLIDVIISFANTLPEGSLPQILISAIPEGILLPFEVVMPTMISIYLIMAILEDSGLMPRIAVMMDRIMSILKLPGQAIIPIVLGFSCRAPGVFGY